MRAQAAVDRLIEPVEIEFRQIAGRRAGARAQSEGFLRRPLKPVVAFEQPAVIAPVHGGVGADARLLLARHRCADHARRDARRRGIAPEEGDIPRHPPDDATRRLRADYRRDRAHLRPIAGRRRWRRVFVAQLANQVGHVHGADEVGLVFSRGGGLRLAPRSFGRQCQRRQHHHARTEPSRGYDTPTRR